MTLPMMLLAIFACLLWASAFMFIKIGMPYTTPLLFAGIRFFLAGILVLVSFRQIKHAFFLLKRFPLYVLSLACLQTFFLYTLFYLGIEKVSGVTAAIIIGSGPISTMILGHYFLKQEKISLSKIMAGLIGFSGITFIALKGKFSFDAFFESSFIGILLLLLSNIFSAAANILVARRKHIESISPIQLNALQMSIGGIFLMILSLTEPSKTIPTHLSFYGALIFLIIISATSHSIWFYLIKKPEIEVSRLNTFKFIIPLAGAILSSLFLAETLHFYHLTGMVLISLSVVFAQKK